jgi:molybdopterin molybdotransferase
MDGPTPTRVLTPLDAVQARIATLGPLGRVETVPLTRAAGRVLAQEVHAAAAVPPRALARRAGIAVRAEETLGASAYAPATLTLAVPVAAGEALPEGADAVLPAEAVERLGAFATASQSAAPGEGVVRAGAELAAGTVVLRAGRTLGPPDLAVAEAAGRADLAVRALPRVAVRLAGAAGAMLRAAAGERGADDAPDLVIAPAEGVPRLAARPIEDAALDLEADPPVLRLPEGAAAWLGWLALGAPLLRRLAGLPEPDSVPARLTRRIASAVGFTDLVLVRLEGDSAEPLAAPDAPSLAALAEADGIVVLPPASEGLPAGAVVSVQRFRP